jgi:N-acetylmuramoyl-L-alanine amidase
MPRLSATLALILPALLTLAPPARARQFNTVVIDAGHGAHDFGAQNGYLFEKHLALDIARRLERFLKRQRLRTVMTRTSDRFIPLDVRASMANGQSNSVLVSIHINHTYRSAPSGVETFYHTAEGARLASFVQREIVSHTNNGGNRGVKFARFRVLRTCARPAILVETGFISNPRDRARLRDPAYREAVARSIGRGLLLYRRS